MAGSGLGHGNAAVNEELGVLRASLVWEAPGNQFQEGNTSRVRLGADE